MNNEKPRKSRGSTLPGQPSPLITEKRELQNQSDQNTQVLIAKQTIYVLGMTQMLGLHPKVHSYSPELIPDSFEGYRDYLSLETKHLTDKSKRNDHTQEMGTNWLQETSDEATSDGEFLAEFAGRICYQAFGKGQHSIGNHSYIQNILKQGHGSVLEHGSVNFLLTGISRTLSHELVRHRAGTNFSQSSQRYVDSSNVKFVMPLHIETSSTAIQDNWYVLCKKALETYEELVTSMADEFTEEEKKSLSSKERRMACRQAARSVLPGCTETKIVYTANFRALRHFCELRGTLHAEPEIRRLAINLTKILKTILPSVFQDFEIIGEGTEQSVSCTYHKV